MLPHKTVTSIELVLPIKARNCSLSQLEKTLEFRFFKLILFLSSLPLCFLSVLSMIFISLFERFRRTCFSLKRGAKIRTFSFSANLFRIFFENIFLFGDFSHFSLSFRIFIPLFDTIFYALPGKENPRPLNLQTPERRNRSRPQPVRNILQAVLNGKNVIFVGMCLRTDNNHTILYQTYEQTEFLAS